MATKDKTVSILGALVTVDRVSLFPQADGSVQLEVVGSTKDSNGAAVALTLPVRTIPAGSPVFDNLVARALVELRKANGLE